MPEFAAHTRPLRRGDVVHERVIDGYLIYGRVWRRFDAHHVVVIDTWKGVKLYRDEELVLSDYTGCWAFGREPWNTRGNTPRWRRMPGLRTLKNMARNYDASFGGSARYGAQWTKAERAEAIANPTRYQTPIHKMAA